jgi:nickel transport system substrate-binding protein
MKAVAEALQSDLRRVGLEVNLIGEETDAFYKRQKTGEFNRIFNNTWGPPYEPHSYLSEIEDFSHPMFKRLLGAVLPPTPSLVA